MIADPFTHLPDLKDMIVEPSRSKFRNLDIAAFDRMMEAAGKRNWRRSDADREATRQAALAGRLDRDLWVFAYGSLMWDPAFFFAEVRSALVKGYRREFCLRAEIGRGTPKRPGLMAGLNQGGECQGLAFRIDGSIVDNETRIVWAREMIMKGYLPRFVELVTPQGSLEALAFIVDKSAKSYMPNLSLEEMASSIATGAGVLGSNFDYLDNLAKHFSAMGIADEALFELHALAGAMVKRGEMD